MFDFALLIPLFAIFFILGVPIMAVATHFVLRPLVRDVIQAMRGREQAVAETEALEARVASLERTLREQGAQLDQLEEAEAFRRQLEARRPDSEPRRP